MKVPLFDPLRAHASFAEELEQAAVSVLRSGRYILGPEVEAFEDGLSIFLGGSHVVSVSSGTDALVLALRALGVGENDEVITTPYSFVATAEAILRVGAKPVFVDVEPNTWMLDSAEVLKARTERTKAVLPVHLFGASFDPDALASLWEDGVVLVEDVAQALGARSKGRVAGTMGDAAAFSFFPTKNLGGYGDGGAIAFREEENAARARRLRVHGRGLRPYESDEAGYNARLDAIQAALLNIKLAHLSAQNKDRRTLAQRYGLLFSEHPVLQALALRWPDAELENGHVFHQFVVEVSEDLRDSLMSHLREVGIGCAIYYPIGLHTQGFLGPHRCAKGAFPVAEAACRSTLALPMFPGMSVEEQDAVVAQMVHFAEEKSSKARIAFTG